MERKKVLKNSYKRKFNFFSRKYGPEITTYLDTFHAVSKQTETAIFTDVFLSQVLTFDYIYDIVSFSLQIFLPAGISIRCNIYVKGDIVAEGFR